MVPHLTRSIYQIQKGSTIHSTANFSSPHHALTKARASLNYLQFSSSSPRSSEKIPSSQSTTKSSEEKGKSVVPILFFTGVLLGLTFFKPTGGKSESEYFKDLKKKFGDSSSKHA
mmetsp:Transcript_14978/g.17229  ORF Transcript_14978/g.17229 Transcript_14978/m.17229 type:complete len:115 (-) Transcript_14978:380-724(-)